MYKKKKEGFFGVSNDASVIPQSPRKDYINIWKVKIWIFKVFLLQ